MTLRLRQVGLQVCLLLTRFGWANGGICLLWLAGALAWGWGLPHLRAQENAQQITLARAKQSLHAMTEVASNATQPATDAPLRQFYDALGETRYAEQQIKTLFAIAAKTGLALNLADYKLASDKDGRYHTYQVVLPVKGSYAAIRQFCEQTLLAIPFASLDEISFKRDTIGNNILEAKLRLTLYLMDSPATGQEIAS